MKDATCPPFLTECQRDHKYIERQGYKRAKREKEKNETSRLGKGPSDLGIQLRVQEVVVGVRVAEMRAEQCLGCGAFGGVAGGCQY
jgi:hypothetical protein